MNKIFEKVSNGLFQGTLKELKTQLKFVGTFGFGITGLYGIVYSLIHHEQIVISRYEVILILLAILSYFFITIVDDVKKIKYDSIEITNIIINLKVNLVSTINSFLELVGYIFVMIPIVELFRKIILSEEVDFLTVILYVQSVLISLSVFYVKNLINNKLSVKHGKKTN
jgi:UDP-N-acetylmuramyl pentapeptide phosphotransferase/UDP-N-acetylglucosamine-1-phosphate transferase